MLLSQKNYYAEKMILSSKSYSAIVSNAFVPKNYYAGKMILSPKSYSAIVSNAFVPEKLLRWENDSIPKEL